MNNKKELNKETLVDIFSVATFGSDWLSIRRPKKFDNLVKEENVCREENWADILLGGGYIAAYAYEDEEEPTRYKVTFDMMKKGFEVFKDECPQDYADFITGNDDYCTCSNLMQCVLFGEVVYG